MFSPPEPAPADEEAPLPPTGWRNAIQTAPLWIPSSGGVLLGILSVLLSLAGIGLAVALVLGSEDSTDWIPGGARAGWLAVVAVALVATALRRSDLVWLCLRIFRRDIPTAIVVSAALLGAALLVIADIGASDVDASSSPESVAAAETSTPATTSAAEATPTPTSTAEPTSTPLAVTAATSTPTPTATPVREPAERPFPLEQLTFDDVCAAPASATYQCGVLPPGGGIARVIEAYIDASPSEEARSCNRASYQALLDGALERNGLALDDTIQAGDVFALPPLPCDEAGNPVDQPDDRGEQDTVPAHLFAGALGDLIDAYAETWTDPTADELDAIAASDQHETLLDVLHYLGDRYEGRPTDFTTAAKAYWIDGDYYLLRVTISARVTSDGCVGTGHRWFALVEVDPTGRLVGVGDARFTPGFRANEACD